MNIIEREDYSLIRSLAKKYNMNVADFGRSIVRQAERSIARAVRLTENEYEYIKDMAKQNNVTVARFCALACHAFVEADNKNIPIEERTDDSKRTKRIEARIYNGADEIALVNYATTYSIKISSLIRYCALHYDGNIIQM